MTAPPPPCPAVKAPAESPPVWHAPGSSQAGRTRREPSSRGRLVHRKPGRVRSDFKKNTPRLPKVNGVKILPVHHRRDPVPPSGQFRQPLALLPVVRRPPGNVVDRSRQHSAGAFPGCPDHIHNGRRTARFRRISKPATLLCRQPETHGIGQRRQSPGDPSRAGWRCGTRGSRIAPAQVRPPRSCPAARAWLPPVPLSCRLDRKTRLPFLRNDPPDR